MKIATLKKLFTENETDSLSWEGICHDCKQPITVDADQFEEDINISNGAIYDTQDDGIFLKCPECFEKDHTLRNFRKTQIYSRCVGYLTPIANWNKGKISEFALRTPFKMAS
jgi:anaerobic ribonucleoside-triphosphate reductase